MIRWLEFFKDLHSTFTGALHTIRMNEKLNPELRKKLEEIFSVSQSHAISAWASELMDGRKEITEEDLKKIDNLYKTVEVYKKEMEKWDDEDGKKDSESEPKKEEPKPAKKLSLREEAINLALKLGDKELAQYLQKAPLKSIQRRIKALREEAEKMGRKKGKYRGK
jgi:hypothetical protein